MSKTILLTCGFCQKEFLKQLREYNRQIKKGAIRFFCDLSCTRKQINKEIPPTGNIANFGDNIRILKKDEYTPFRYYVKMGKTRSTKTKRYTCNITVEFLKDLWEKQKGICPITGWNLILPKDNHYMWDEKVPNNASLDRIDNSKGYIEGNVRFIAFIANMARNEFSDDQVIEFCKATTENNK